MLKQTLDQAIIGEIVRRILQVAEPDRIILFGSAAAGSMTPDSDVDLLILESSPTNTRKESIRVRGALRGLGLSFDILVMSTDRFEEARGIVGGIAFAANTHGKILYDAA